MPGSSNQHGRRLKSWPRFHQNGSLWSMDSGSTKIIPFYNFALTFTTFCDMWDGKSLLQVKFRDCGAKCTQWSFTHLIFDLYITIGLIYLLSATQRHVTIFSLTRPHMTDPQRKILQIEISVMFTGEFRWRKMGWGRGWEVIKLNNSLL